MKYKMLQVYSWRFSPIFFIFNSHKPFIGLHVGLKVLTFIKYKQTENQQSDKPIMYYLYDYD